MSQHEIVAKVTYIGAESSHVGGDHGQVTAGGSVPLPPRVGLGMRCGGEARRISVCPATRRDSSWGSDRAVAARKAGGGPERAAGGEEVVAALNTPSKPS